jgi:Rrf2 family transcriptional regulator, cysteine metabolism repressor
MEKILNFTEKTNVVIHSLALIAAHPDSSTVSVKHIAKVLEVSESYLAKVLQPIVKAGLLESSRGAKGGYALKKKPNKIKILDLILLLEGKFPPSQCLFDRPRCSDEACPFRRLSTKVKETVIKELEGFTIADVAKNFKDAFSD